MITKLSWPLRKPPLLSQFLPHISYFNQSFARPPPAKFSTLDPIRNLSEAMNSSSNFSEAQKIHARLISAGFCSSVFLENTLLHAYFRFGAVGDARLLFESISSPNTISCNIMITGLSKSAFLEDARKVFDEMPVRDSASWNSLMSGYFCHGMSGETIEIFTSMVWEAHENLDVFSFTVASKAVGSLRRYELALQLHGLVEKLGFGGDIQIKRSLIDMHIKCGSTYMAAKIFERMGSSADIFCWNSMILGYFKLYGVECALKLFDDMPERDTVSWNTMISVLSQHGWCRETISMIPVMQFEGLELTSTTYTCGLTCCSQISGLDWGRQLHARLMKSEKHIDVFMGSALVDMYANCGSLDAARRAFDFMPAHNTVSWTSLISGYAQLGNAEEAAGLFNRMRRKQTSFDKFTLSTVISSCYNGGDPDVHLGCQLHCLCLKTGYTPSTPVSNALLTFYAKCGRTESSESVFCAMNSKDVVSWTSMITAYAQSGPINKAREYFDSTPMRNVVTWNAIFGAYILNGEEEEALKLFILMLREDDVRPDWVTFVRLLSAAADLGAFKLGTQIISHTMKCGHNDSSTSVSNGIITMYSKCGKIEDARRTFDLMAGKDLVSWNAMISSYSQHGLGAEAVEIFEKMLLQQVEPDYISYVAVLSGCGHSGLVSEGKSRFEQMTRVHGIAPRTEHFACMVDLLGRAGLLEEAKGVIESMPIQPTAEVWGALLGACRIHNHTELADFAAKNQLKMDSTDSGSYILMAKLYADAGDLGNSAGMRKLMKERGIRKKPGCSWIEIEDRIHVFVADDLNHPHIHNVLRVLGELIERIEAVGYVNQDSLHRSKRHHSEKLAVAFGVMKSPQWMPIRVMKNLRICGDCHDVIRLISLVCEREFVVRDAIRFHHFKDGSCSCREYW